MLAETLLLLYTAHDLNTYSVLITCSCMKITHHYIVYTNSMYIYTYAVLTRESSLATGCCGGVPYNDGGERRRKEREG